MSSTRLSKSFFEDISITMYAIEKDLLKNKKGAKYKPAIDLVRANIQTLEKNQYRTDLTSILANNAAFALAQINQAVQTTDKIAKTAKPTHLHNLQDQINKINAYAIQSVEERYRLVIEAANRNEKAVRDELKSVKQAYQKLEAQLNITKSDLEKSQSEVKKAINTVADTRTSLAVLTESLAAEQAKLKSDEENHKNSINTLNAQIQINEDTFAQKFAHQNFVFLGEKAELNDAHKVELSEINQHLSVQQALLNNELCTLATSHEDRVKELESKYGKEILELKQTFEAEKAQLAAEISLFKSQGSDNMANVDSTSDALKSAQEKQLEILHSQTTDLNKANEDLVVDSVLDEKTVEALVVAEQVAAVEPTQDVVRNSEIDVEKPKSSTSFLRIFLGHNKKEKAEELDKNVHSLADVVAAAVSMKTECKVAESVGSNPVVTSPRP